MAGALQNSNASQTQIKVESFVQITQKCEIQGTITATPPPHVCKIKIYLFLKYKSEVGIGQTNRISGFK